MSAQLPLHLIALAIDGIGPDEAELLIDSASQKNVLDAAMKLGIERSSNWVAFRSGYAARDEDDPGWPMAFSLALKTWAACAARFLLGHAAAGDDACALFTERELCGRRAFIGSERQAERLALLIELGVFEAAPRR